MPSAKRCIARSYSQKVRVRDERKVMSTETRMNDDRNLIHLNPLAVCHVKTKVILCRYFSLLDARD